jgi:transposase-like protein
MGAPIDVREDFGAAALRRLAVETKDADQARRLLALAAVYDGMSREDAARIGGMDRQTLRDWVHRFNRDGADGLIDGKSPGRPPKLSAEQQEVLRQLVEAGPDPDKDGVVRWMRGPQAGASARSFARRSMFMSVNLSTRRWRGSGPIPRY